MSGCGCDGNSNNNLNILNSNSMVGRTNNMMNNIPQVNNIQHSNNIPQVNNIPQINNIPQQQVNNYPRVEEKIGLINNLVKGTEEKKDIKLEDNNILKEVKMTLYIILALSVHEAVKFFISQSIRMNRGSSSRFVYYPIIVVGILLLLNLF